MPNMFDLITSFEVIEHINNPNEELHFSKFKEKVVVFIVLRPTLIRY